MLAIRSATINDVPLLRRMIWELAEFEKEPDEVCITEAQLATDGFDVNPKFRALIAEWDREPAGYAVFFGFYSTWSGPHIFLEDLFVRPQFRGKGIGRNLMAKVAEIARQENCTAMRWEVLEWNESAIEGYRNLGAEFLKGWKGMLLRGDSLRQLAERAQ